MKVNDQYHKRVEGSDVDQVYIGRCPDLLTGIHGDDLVRLYGELREAAEDVIQHFIGEGRALPRPRVRLMQEVA
jgi:hypothetical protein